jgi:hypothetical protein
MNMVEKIAQSIKEIAWEAKSKGYAGTDRAWDEMAKAAIEAMREPTPTMIEAQREGLVREFGLTVTDGYLLRIHDKIIDSALKDPQEDRPA